MPLINYINTKCFEFYQPVQRLAVDERMIKSKARLYLKVGFHIAGYTLDFYVYTVKDTNGKSDHGLA